MTQAIWTLDELAGRVGAALSVGYGGQPSGRVRHLPDQRAIRWYTTIGLVDRPAATRGRTAMYGPRHLLQLVAIKRLQAQGLPLVTIQAELAGATDTQLARVAQVPREAGLAEAAAPPRRPTAALHTATARPPSHGAPRAVTKPAADQGEAGEAGAASPPAAPAPGQGATPAAAPTLAASQSLARQARFWRQRPAEAAGMAAGSSAVAEAATAAEEATAAGTAAGVATLQGVRLGERVTLLLDPARPLDDADLRAILDAAGPLLRALRARGLDHFDNPGRELP